MPLVQGDCIACCRCLLPFFQNMPCCSHVAGPCSGWEDNPGDSGFRCGKYPDGISPLHAAVRGGRRGITRSNSVMRNLPSQVQMSATISMTAAMAPIPASAMATVATTPAAMAPTPAIPAAVVAVAVAATEVVMMAAVPWQRPRRR